MSGGADPYSAGEMRSRFCAMAAAVAEAAEDLAAVEEHTADVLVRSAALRPHRAPELLALATQARAQALRSRALHAYWREVATRGWADNRAGLPRMCRGLPARRR
jgi:hypothetical protein